MKIKILKRSEGLIYLYVIYFTYILNKNSWYHKLLMGDEVDDKIIK